MCVCVVLGGYVGAVLLLLVISSAGTATAPYISRCSTAQQGQWETVGGAMGTITLSVGQSFFLFFFKKRGGGQEKKKTVIGATNRTERKVTRQRGTGRGWDRWSRVERSRSCRCGGEIMTKSSSLHVCEGGGQRRWGASLRKTISLVCAGRC